MRWSVRLSTSSSDDLSGPASKIARRRSYPAKHIDGRDRRRDSTPRQTLFPNNPIQVSPWGVDHTNWRSLSDHARVVGNTLRSFGSVGTCGVVADMRLEPVSFLMCLRSLRQSGFRRDTGNRRTLPARRVGFSSKGAFTPPSRCSLNGSWGGAMSHSNTKSQDSWSWRTLYRSAILSVNIGVKEERIKAAEQAVIARARELYRESGPEVEIERDALDDALYALRALRNTLTLGTAA